MKNTKNILMAVIFAALVLAASQALAEGKDRGRTKVSAKRTAIEKERGVFYEGNRSGQMGRRSDGRVGRVKDGRRRGLGMEFMRQRQERYIKWLDESYPEEAEALNELKANNPKLYLRRMRLSGRK